MLKIFITLLFIMTLSLINLIAQEDNKNDPSQKPQAEKPQESKQEEAKQEEAKQETKISEKTPEEIKQILMKEQEKKAIENAQLFFRLIKNKKTMDATKLLSIPFLYDDHILLDKNEITKLLTEVSTAESENFFFEIPFFSLHKKQKNFTENNILIIVQERNAEDPSQNILVLIDRNSLKITGIFPKLDDNNKIINEKIKSKLTNQKPLEEEK